MAHFHRQLDNDNASSKEEFSALGSRKKERKQLKQLEKQDVRSDKAAAKVRVTSAKAHSRQYKVYAQATKEVTKIQDGLIKDPLLPSIKHLGKDSTWFPNAGDKRATASRNPQTSSTKVAAKVEQMKVKMNALKKQFTKGGKHTS